jgi:hypothetical protein
MVTDRILMIEPVKIKTYLRLGTDIGKFNMVNRDGKMYEWLEDTYVPETTTCTGLSSGTTTTTFTPASLTLLQPGDVLLIDSEQVWVSAVASGIPTVTRGFGSTTAATHADASTVTIVSRARIDGDDADDSPSTEVSTGYNYTQIFQRTIQVARTKQKLAAYGVNDVMDRMIDKRMTELMMQLNKLPFYGKRYAGTASAARYAGGLRVFITDNLTDCGSDALTRKDIDDTLQNIFDDGGDPDLIICGGWAQRKMNDFYEGFVTTERSEKVGGIRIQRLLHPITGTELDILVDRACPTNELWILSSKYISYYAFDPFFYEKLSKTGDSDKGEVVGEYGFVNQFDKAHGLVHTFSTTA